MEDSQLQKDIVTHRNKKEFPFWSVVIAIMSILQGGFIFKYDGYILAHSEPYITSFPERTIGFLLVFLGLAKLVAIVMDNKKLSRYVVWGSSFIWSGLLGISVAYSFGTGHPDPSWFFYALVVVIGYRVSLKGGY